MQCWTHLAGDLCTQGFIKYALQHGYKVYPCYTFGEERTYFNIAVWTDAAADLTGCF